ncbi:hypothetical protein MWN52_11700 [Pseudoxanthomonas winnipegensis]|uniref:hypothetical protein n=1 Tax=Pseudoxanthomonas winnipegensis TaxID=2480810 RepID=UPI002575F219|nr:hypothetical protein [Pseudoxanthomonas winnipegensis]WJI14307.1 hypothetical protein MWN52_11700 [Pseudoxanthomonas winnipegensis]
MGGRKRRIYLFVAPLIAWLCLLAIGMALCRGVQLHNVPGYSNKGQLTLYVCLPSFMVASNLFLLWASMRIPRWASYLLLFCQVPLWMVAFALFGGGV